MGIPAIGPCTEQNSIRAYFHRATVMENSELFELEKRIRHKY
jgi:hypothetical protein